MFGDIQKYGEHTDVQGMNICMKVYRCGGYTDNPIHTDGETYHPHAYQLHLGSIFLIKFKFVLHRHIRLAYHLA